VNERILFLECYSGISGDMTVAALLDLGADKDTMIAGLNSLAIDGYEIKIGRVKKNGIDACDFDVVVKELDNYNNHCYEHRNIREIFHIIDSGDLSEKVKVLSKKIFTIVAQAEAKAHGIELNMVHFHEVGAIDSIIDIIATAICLENLGIEEVIISEIFEGGGHVKCRHGLIPVPVPAVVNILREYNLTVKMTENKGEMITPTGAAIAAAIHTRKNFPDSIKFENVGIGAGKKDFSNANILRAFIINEISGII
jgi:uncharacterized protein (TIGR00299 family) protein